MSISDTFPRGSVVAELIMRSHRNTLTYSERCFSLSLSLGLDFYGAMCGQREKTRQVNVVISSACWINGQTRNIKIAPCCVTNGIFGGCRPAGVCGGPLTHSAASSDLTRARHTEANFLRRAPLSRIVLVVLFVFVLSSCEE